MALSTFQTVQLITMIFSGTLSFIGSVLVILTIIKNKLYKSLAFRILMYISINDALRSSIGILPPELVNNEVICSLLAFINVTTFLSNLIWACCLSFTIFQIIVLEDAKFDKFHVYWFIAAYGVAVFLCALPFITSSYGYYEHVCELSLNLTGIIWKFSVLYLPGSIILIVICVLFVKVYRKLKAIRSNAMKNIIFNRGFIYPLIIGISMVPYEILRIIQIFYNNDSISYTGFCFFLLFLLHGFINAVIFFTNSTVKEILKDKNNEISASFGIASEYDSDLKISFRSTLN